MPLDLYNGTSYGPHLRTCSAHNSFFLGVISVTLKLFYTFDGFYGKQTLMVLLEQKKKGVQLPISSNFYRWEINILTDKSAKNWICFLIGNSSDSGLQNNARNFFFHRSKKYWLFWMGRLSLFYEWWTVARDHKDFAQKKANLFPVWQWIYCHYNSM